jgi:hypothetical protein
MIALSGPSGPSGGDGPRRIDFRSIRFPSDSLSFGALRALDSEMFDLGGRIEGDRYDRVIGFFERTLVNVLCCEREVAHSAYARIAGLPPADEFGVDYVPLLEQQYIALGMASGQHHARQLIREIESQAAALAGKQMP